MTTVEGISEPERRLPPQAEVIAGPTEPFLGVPVGVERWSEIPFTVTERWLSRADSSRMDRTFILTVFFVAGYMLCPAFHDGRATRPRENGL